MKIRNYIVWYQIPYEGYTQEAFETLKEARAFALAHEDAVITKLIK